MSAGLAEVLAKHVFADSAICWCPGVPWKLPSNERCDECKPAITEVTAAVTEWLGERLREAREDVALEIAKALPLVTASEDHALGIVTFANDMPRGRSTADAALSAVSAALGVRDE